MERLNDVCAYLHNYFEAEKHEGQWSIVNGSITLPFVSQGQFFIIKGSKFNDGIHRYPLTVGENMEADIDENTIDLTSHSMIDGNTLVLDAIDPPIKDETWQGEIIVMNVPNALILLTEEIDQWIEKNTSALSAYQSESFGGYSYSKAVGKDGTPADWMDVFAKRLQPWKKSRFLYVD